ncbi:FimV/HubP family polar landmark protein [Psychromonas sp. KJ10-10]|uniref:FimV/HubP family polar landmark protein n=1 Tax=Psychromonas sp. KJ10-10 TaxID=3391823 RepID=UPI0039B5C1F5
MKRFLLSLICCTPLLFVSSMSLSVDLTGPNGETATDYQQYGPISRSETLWAISTQLRPDNSVSVHQTMVALYKLNPNAFDDGNINRIIANSTLQVPSYDYVAQQTNQEVAELIRKYSTPKVEVVKKVAPKVEVITPEEPKVAPKEIIEEVVEPVVKEEINQDSEKLIESEAKLSALQEEMRLLNEQFIVATEVSQVLKLKLQAFIR